MEPYWQNELLEDAKTHWPTLPGAVIWQRAPVVALVGHCGDQAAAAITLLAGHERRLYLAIVLDLYEHKVVGWTMVPSTPAELICDALNMAIQQRQPAPGLIVHSDRGSQHASALYQDLLDTHGFVCSMSHKGNCWERRGGTVLPEP